MKKYSRIVGLDIAQKYGITDFKVTVNYRAHRSVNLSTNTVDLHEDGNDGRHYSCENGSMFMKSGVDGVKVVHDDNGVMLVIPQLFVRFQDADIIFEEVETAIIRILKDGGVGHYLRSHETDLNDNKCWELIEQHRKEMLGGVIEDDLVNLIIDVEKGLDGSILHSEYPVISLIRSIQMAYPDTKFFSSGEFLKYKTFFKMNTGHSRNALDYLRNNRKPMNTREEVFAGTSLAKNMYDLFQTGVFENFFGSYYSQPSFKTLELYPDEVIRMLRHYCCNGIIDRAALKRFEETYTPEMFNKPGVLDAWRKFMAHDYKFSEIDDFCKILVYLKSSGIAVTNRTANMRFMSVLKNKRCGGYDPSKLDTFEQMLEKDAIKAIDYLRSSETKA